MVSLRSDFPNLGIGCSDVECIKLVVSLRFDFCDLGIGCTLTKEGKKMPFSLKTNTNNVSLCR